MAATVSPIHSSVHTFPFVPTPIDGLPSSTSSAQESTEQTHLSILSSNPPPSPLLNKQQHFSYLTRILSTTLPAPYTSLDASRPWLLYWTLHSMALFNGSLDAGGKARVVETLRSFQNSVAVDGTQGEGGFGGGVGQKSHLAPSWAAVCAATYAGKAGWEMIDRKGMYRFLLSMKQSDGSFIMHDHGEVDVRGSYCALSIATLLNLLTPELVDGCAAFIASCQTYEGGLAASAFTFPSLDSHTASPAVDHAHPANGGSNGHANGHAHQLNHRTAPMGETHGGYTFCALASWCILRAFDDQAISPPLPFQSPKLNLNSLLRWSTSMQANAIDGGGFKGRTNKLVDGCYGWWCGGLFSLVNSLMGRVNHSAKTDKIDTGMNDGDAEVYDRVALQEYVLYLAQAPSGGLRDKPTKPVDAYHTSMNLSGLSAAQSRLSLSSTSISELSEAWVDPFEPAKIEEEGEEGEAAGKAEMISGAFESDAEASKRMQIVWSRSLGWKLQGEMILVGGEENELTPTHPIMNVTMKHVARIMAHFYRQDIPTHLVEVD